MAASPRSNDAGPSALSKASERDDHASAFDAARDTTSATVVSPSDVRYRKAYCADSDGGRSTWSTVPAAVSPLVIPAMTTRAVPVGPPTRHWSPTHPRGRPLKTYEFPSGAGEKHGRNEPQSPVAVDCTMTAPPDADSRARASSARWPSDDERERLWSPKVATVPHRTPGGETSGCGAQPTHAVSVMS